MHKWVGETIEIEDEVEIGFREAFQLGQVVKNDTHCKPGIIKVGLYKRIVMPVISMFFGMIVRMFYRDNKQHKLPHIHVEYQDDVAVFSIPDGEILAGSLPGGKVKLVKAWIEIYKDDLMADWKLAVEGQEVFKIDGLK